MDQKTRTLRALQGLSVDRVPVGFYTHFPDQTDNTVSAQVKWALDTRMDLLCMETDGYMEWAPEQPLLTASDWGRIRPHKKEDHYIAGQVDRAARIAEGLGDKAASFYMIYTPYSTIKHTLGGETRVNELYRENPQAMTDAMKVIEEDNFNLIEMIKESGVAGVAVSFQNAEEWRFTPEEYREILTPWDKRLLAALRENFEYVNTHLCSWGNEPNNFHVWQDYDMMCVNWGVHIERDMPLVKGREYFPSHPAVMGGFDVRPDKLIIKGTEQEIKDYTKQIIRDTGRIGLLIGSDCSLHDDTPDQNIRYVVEAVEEYEAE